MTKQTVSVIKALKDASNKNCAYVEGGILTMGNARGDSITVEVCLPDGWYVMTDPTMPRSLSSVEGTVLHNAQPGSAAAFGCDGWPLPPPARGSRRVVITPTGAYAEPCTASPLVSEALTASCKLAVNMDYLMAAASAGVRSMTFDSPSEALLGESEEPQGLTCVIMPMQLD